MAHFETKEYPVIRAANYTDANRGEGDVRLIVVHSTESGEREGGARAVANYFAKSSTRASAHYCIDNKEIIQCVWDSDVAWAAPGANGDGLQLELIGTAHQNRQQWMDPYSSGVLENAANIAAQLAIKFHIPVKKLSNAELSGGQRGFIGHVQASEVYKRSSHWDPGPNFPWDFFMERVRHYYAVYNDDEPTPENDFDVVVSASGDVDKVPAFMLAHKHIFKFLPADQLGNHKIGYVVAVGLNADDMVAQVGDGVALTGANRYETAKIVLDKILGDAPDRTRPWPNG